jgi:hypothetical protein
MRVVALVVELSIVGEGALSCVPRNVLSNVHGSVHNSVCHLCTALYKNFVR